MSCCLLIVQFGKCISSLAISRNSGCSQTFLGTINLSSGGWHWLDVKLIPFWNHDDTWFADSDLHVSFKACNLKLITDLAGFKCWTLVVKFPGTENELPGSVRAECIHLPCAPVAPPPPPKYAPTHTHKTNHLWTTAQTYVSRGEQHFIVKCFFIKPLRQVLSCQPKGMCITDQILYLFCLY